MQQKIVTITIDENGDSTVDLAGFHGRGCGAIQEAFSKAVGKSVAVTDKAEFHAPCQNKNQLNQSR